MAKTKLIPASASNTSAHALQIDEIIAFPVSFPVKDGVTLGIGRAVKRDAVVVRVGTKGGGITEALRIAAMASAWKLPIHPHTSTTCLNMAANIHFLAAIENGGYFEADTAKANAFRDHLGTRPYKVDAAGKVYPLEGPGLGVEIDEIFIKKHPLIEGPGFV